MIEYDNTCPQCRGRMREEVTQSIHPIDGRVMYYTYITCNDCGYNTHTEDYGIPPEGIRQQLLEENGLYELVIYEVDRKSRLEMTKLLRSSLDMSTGEALKLSKTLPGVLYSGTEVECRWLEQALSEQRIEAVVRKGFLQDKVKVKLKRFGFFDEMTGEERVNLLVAQERRQEFEKETVRYLSAGVEYMLIAGVTYDYLGSDKRVIGPPHILTDGCWAWTKDVLYYISRYHIKLPEELVEHMKSRDWKMPGDVELREVEL